MNLEGRGGELHSLLVFPLPNHFCCILLTFTSALQPHIPCTHGTQGTQGTQGHRAQRLVLLGIA